MKYFVIYRINASYPWTLESYSSKDAKKEAETAARSCFERGYEVMIFTPCVYSVHESKLVKVE